MYAELVADSAKGLGADDDQTLASCRGCERWAIEADDILACLFLLAEVLSLRGAKAGTVAEILCDLLLRPAAGPHLADAPDVVALLIEIMPRVTSPERILVGVTLMAQSALMPPAMRMDAAVKATAHFGKPAEFLVALLAAVNMGNPCFRKDPEATRAWIDATESRPGFDILGSWAWDLVAASGGDAEARLRLPSEFVSALELMAVSDSDGASFARRALRDT
jgi:hypothetical protein